ncbi:MAG: biotin/lipoyl-containing protein [Sphingomicrobium sp.]
MDEVTRAAICDAAVRAAKAVDYVGAGTIEFIADASEGLRADRIWFMEMNTRLQVEHPVTEEITGVDLVEWQLRVASGEALPKKQDELSISGWAIEARLYAEDPAKGFLPSIGRLNELHFGDYRKTRPVRVETGVAIGDEVSQFYDPMIAKLIVHRNDRSTAIAALKAVTSGVTVWPVKTNAGFLTKALADPAFVDGNIDTGLIAREGERLIPDTEPSLQVLEAAASYAVFVSAEHGVEEEFASNDRRNSPWSRLDGFRVGRCSSRQTWLSHGNKTYEVSRTDAPTSLFTRYTSSGLTVTDAGQTFVFGRASSTTSAAAGDGAIVAPMPGKVTSVEVAAGDAVTKGQRLLTLEAMKMEHGLVAPFDGVVAEVNAAAGAQVGEGAVLVRVTAANEKKPS